MPDTEPKSMEHAISWFKQYEVPRGVGMERDGSMSLWFHGKLVRVVLTEHTPSLPPVH